MPETLNLFLIDLTYVKPVEEIDPLLEAHYAFLDRQYADGIFLASGPKVPRTGGAIIARGTDRAALEEILTQDPFFQAKVAEYTVTEFIPKRHAVSLQEALTTTD